MSNARNQPSQRQLFNSKTNKKTKKSDGAHARTGDVYESFQSGEANQSQMLFNSGNDYYKNGSGNHSSQFYGLDTNENGANMTPANQRKPNYRTFDVKTPTKLKFEEYWSMYAANEGIVNGSLIEGILRINPRNFNDAYVSVPGEAMDINIIGMQNRNRALNGDKVAVQLFPANDWKILHDDIQSNWHVWQLECNKQNFAPEVTELAADIASLSVNAQDSQDNTDGESSFKQNSTPQKKKRRQRKKKPTESENVAVTAMGKSLTTPKKNLPQEITHWTVGDLLSQPFGRNCVQKTAKVVAIIEKLNSRVAGGRIRLNKDKNMNWALFSPVDPRVPRLMIPMSECPNDFYSRPQHYADSLFVATIGDWDASQTFPSGQLKQRLGNAGDVNVETKMILMEYGIDETDFTPEEYVGIPGLDEEHYSIPDIELSYRRDFRKECVFTIDPATARDLDDALSIRLLEETVEGKELYEVGVHIADVSHFLKEDMRLDITARARTTSVYLVQKVIPMLPRILCEKHCSLTSGEDKLTFSVVWKMDLEGNIYSEWFGRTIINSCVKLSYEYAQDMIDAADADWEQANLPQISSNHSANEIAWCVNKLMTVSRSLRIKRINNGALRIDKLKLSFVLDSETGMPSAFSAHSHIEANYLVEELMLLANMAVATKIYKAYPELSFLRNHQRPDEKLLKDFVKFCEYNNFDVDCSSSAALQRTLKDITEGNEVVSKVVSHFLLRSMKNATYFCSGMLASEADFHHYALNVPLYTHFTSPIRRYPDVIVHRKY